ncbi:MAG: Asp-tRNA(Asn)/Glu-tRNA(Gln) amidotransferase GatCAB subunit C, partial [Bacilli bacterium]|nr:Asp-tRNA(Asn)/Glu-tRNA(Gln) amidotransferase GatCAB subunit C [Bacilli bacterium]
MERTNRNGTLRIQDVGKKVVLLGWIAKTRKLGGLFFADLRDTTGYIQLVSENPDSLPDVRNEYVVEVRGIVRKKDVPNPNLPTGEVEVLIEKLTVINKAELTP